QSAPPASSPPPRLRARSMLSFGTDDFFAFWMASYSVGLPAGSPPPVRAATSMFLINLAKSLPRFASIPAFLCLVVAHLEWPLIPYFLQSTARLIVRTVPAPAGLTTLPAYSSGNGDLPRATTGPREPNRRTSGAPADRR